ncbi:transcription factor TCP5 [Amborella trichopoda]|uniref:TCP domain-containing protein n=1 Tax=Amborella trichopoda TaxID=13333 RepID=W1PIK2_AMBTC|nr:transcription factor TCP5 [Amborella trichopoda]XP_011623969.1 transcription factor TCP5 [Amborella trichopoda]XP_020523844.1 transcription factor TCP5 [Amborella trichopoda]XP_020523845.1 transcription factor TCP5 [Amborella trichopoda]XP_020523846.1 transcription factor TCP5 [Amborella trichopoda]XP_020523847.1 transcription factor TCP5 [Amborella trichopoda]XP_020523848.1 transcription factor TCP5 [Amborella trichopoda]ERN07554.1 hypothetical protein AMTR_s00154p00072430 [Amborella tri|eukprot:XP_006845879.1 transcription factor TCP5 [Amborella trichopoda]
MIRDSRLKASVTKQEDGIDDGNKNKGSSSSKPWSGPRDPRIVRVSRTFGGKDRHSKVSTIKGLRDRRVRLSVPTAIQLYDLQERLGFNQPSKVVDWLLAAARHEIDELPPLQFEQANFHNDPSPQLIFQEITKPLASSNSASDSLVGFKDTGACSLSLFSSNKNVTSSDATIGGDQTNLQRTSTWNLDSLREKSSVMPRDKDLGKSSSSKTYDHEYQENIHTHGSHVLAYNPVPTPNQSSFSSVLNNMMPGTSYYHWEHTNPALSNAGSHGYPSQAIETHNSNTVSLPPSLSLVSMLQPNIRQISATPSQLATYFGAPLDLASKQLSHPQLLSMNSQHMNPNSLGPPVYAISPTMRPFQVNFANYHNPHQRDYDNQSNTLAKETASSSNDQLADSSSIGLRGSNEQHLM